MTRIFTDKRRKKKSVFIRVIRVIRVPFFLPFMLHEEITDKIIKAFYTVNNALGFGFLEKVYENAMAIELRKSGCYVEKQKNIKVYYDQEEVGDYYADLLVERQVIVELKAAESLCKDHEAQLINYLKATDIEVGLLVNFGKRAEFKRKVFTNDRKRKLPTNDLE